MKRIWVSFLATLIVLVASDYLYAADGDFDITFGTDGVVMFDGGNGQDYVVGVAIQSDGKIVAAGLSNNGADSDVLLLRYNSDGTLDTTFDTDGVVIYDGGNGTDGVIGVAIQSDGKIVATGTKYNGADLDVLLLRYNSDGTLDTTFDTDGVVIYDGGNGGDQATHVAIQSDGKIVVAGYSSNGADNDALLLRYNSDGTLDTTFDTDGVIIYDGGNGDDLGRGIAIQPDGKIVVAGHSSNVTDNDALLLRYNSDGTLDTTFDTDGVVIYDGGNGDDKGFDIEIQPDGKIVVAGYRSNGADNDALLLRYNSDGTLDTTFDTDGVVIYDGGNGYDYATGIAIQPDEKIVVSSWGHNGADSDVLLLRYNSDGTFDITFDTDGVVTYDGGNGADLGSDIAIQPDGKIIVVGRSFNGADDDILLLRFLSTPPDDGVVDSGGGVGCFIATAAYGSYIEPKVTILRQFRDSYLLTNKLGMKFVEVYYKHSPPMANYIAEHDSLRSAARIGLAPFVGFSWLAVNYGMLIALAVLFSVLTMIIGATCFVVSRRETS